MPSSDYLISVIANTRGYVLPDVMDCLKGSHLIIHAGGVGWPFVLDALEKIAPVVTVRGQVSKQSWEYRLPKSEVVQAGGKFLYVLHDIRELDLDPAAAGFAAVISGYPPAPSVEWRNGVLFLSLGGIHYGSVTLGRLWVDGDELQAGLVKVEITT